MGYLLIASEEGIELLSWLHGQIGYCCFSETLGSY